MAYQLSIKVKDGVAEIEQSLATPPPDGRFVILGEINESSSPNEMLSLERRGTNDAIVIHLSGSR